VVRTVNFVNDILIPFITNKALIEGLAISDVPEFKDMFHKIKWSVSFPSGAIELNCNEYSFIPGQRENLLMNYEDAKVPSVGIPGGYLGIQAFYLILENFWRNLVKHNVEKIKERVKSPNDNFIKINIEIEDKERTPFWRISLWADIKTAPSSSKEIQQIIQKGIIDNHGKLIAEGWGTKEMLIAAAYLKSSPIMNIQPPKSESVLHCDLKYKNYLCYSFDMLKPMELFILTKKTINENSYKELINKGVFILDKVEENMNIPTEYLICNDDKFDTDCLKKSLIPLKVFKEDQIVLDDLTNDNRRVQFLIYLESSFIKQIVGEREIKLIIRSRDEKDKTVGCFQSGNLSVKCLDSIDLKGTNINKEIFIIFDRHGNLNNNDKLRKIKADFFWEPYGGGTQTAFLLQHTPPDNKRKELLAWQMATAAMLRVAILDERIQQILDKLDLTWKYGEGPAIAPLDCLRMMRIFIPHTSICEGHFIDAENKLNLENPEEDKINEWIGKVNPHILSIHAGILDKVGKKRPEDVINWVNIILGTLNENIKRVVIHSGRGIPVNVPDLEVPFIGYTPIEHFTTSKDLKSKYELVQELLAARGVKR